MKLIASDLTYRAGSREIIDSVSLTASSGRILAVQGPSGAGKTTLLSLLGGLRSAASGRVVLDDSELETQRQRFGFVLQNYGLVDALTVLENVTLPLQARRVDRRDARRRALDMLERVGLLDVVKHLADELSGGQQQRVAVARALVAAPDVLLADEPTAELDSDNRGAVMALLEQHARQGAVVVLTSHDRDISSRCDDVLLLDSGRVLA